MPTKKQMAWIIVALGLVTLIIPHLAALCPFLALPSLWWLLKQRIRDRNLKAIHSALPMLHGIYGGRLFVGKDAVVVDTRRLDCSREPGPLQLEQLCKTTKGQWFTFRFETRNGGGIPYDFAVTPCDEDEARRWLAASPEIYIREFGQPEAA